MLKARQLKMGLRKMEVLIDNQQQKLKINLEQLQQTAQAILSALNCPEGELSILIVDDDRIETLNKKYLQRDGPTNVIAFPMQEGDFSNIAPQLLGDVVICVETAQKEARLGGITMEERLYQLLIHGILHLFGYDHEKTNTETLAMETKTQELLSLIAT